jgi:AhpD family alkylhydroperoxidase
VAPCVSSAIALLLTTFEIAEVDRSLCALWTFYLIHIAFRLIARRSTDAGRLEAQKVSPAAYQAMLGLEMFVRKQSKLEPAVIELVKMRTSQINGCAYCIDMHSKDARAEGETEQRIYALSAWEETPFFTDRERAALALAEAITLVREGHVPEAVYERAKKSFSEEELVNLTLAIITINGWNRLAITFRSVPGEYQPGRK